MNINIFIKSKICSFTLMESETLKLAPVRAWKKPENELRENLDYSCYTLLIFFLRTFKFLHVRLLIELVVNGKYKSITIDFTANLTRHGWQLKAKSFFFFCSRHEDFLWYRAHNVQRVRWRVGKSVGKKMEHTYQFRNIDFLSYAIVFLKLWERERGKR